MSSLKDLRWSPVAPRHPQSEAARRFVAIGLRRASAVLARLSRRLARPAAKPVQTEPQLEFYADQLAVEVQGPFGCAGFGIELQLRFSLHMPNRRARQAP